MNKVGDGIHLLIRTKIQRKGINRFTNIFMIIVILVCVVLYVYILFAFVFILGTF